MNAVTRAIYPQMVGGDEDQFFQRFWRKRTLFTESGLPQLAVLYDVDRFLQDYRHLDCHDATLLISVDRQGNRKMSRVSPGDSVDTALARGMSMVVQALLLPPSLSNIPPQWELFISLHQALCEYLLPLFPSRMQLGGPVAAVDIFCTFAETSSGGHYDTGDVFYFVLDGEKEWTVELVPDLDQGLRLASEQVSCDLCPQREYLKVLVKPGDCLYVPPYTYHRVCSRGKSVAVSVGLPAFTELSLMRTSLVRIQRERKLYEPLPSFPRSQQVLSCAAEEEVKRRLLRTLGLLGPEHAAVH